jgi:hypothetical protein
MFTFESTAKRVKPVNWLRAASEPLGAQVRKCRTGAASEPLGARKCRTGAASEPLGVRKCRTGAASEPLSVRKCRTGAALEPPGARKCRTGAASEPLNWRSKMQEALRWGRLALKECGQRGCSKRQSLLSVSSVLLFSVPLCSVHGYARVHTSIYIYIYIYMVFFCFLILFRYLLGYYVGIIGAFG